jgi:hypothetical protein
MARHEQISRRPGARSQPTRSGFLCPRYSQDSYTVTDMLDHALDVGFEAGVVVLCIVAFALAALMIRSLWEPIVVLLPGPERWHRRVARNPRAATLALRWLVRRRGLSPAVLAALFDNRGCPEPVREQVVRRSEVHGGIAVLVPDAGERVPPQFLRPLTLASDPVLVQRALRRLGRHIEEPQVLDAYARLAVTAGPELVWDLELERAGSLDAMLPPVRASMASGSAEPLLEPHDLRTVT